MGLANKCDRCGKLYEYYPNGRKYQANAIRKLQMDRENYINTNEQVKNLCPECMSEFDKWMIGGKFKDDQT